MKKRARRKFESMDELSFSLSPIKVLRDNIRKNVENLASYYVKAEKICNRRLENIVETYENAKQ